MDIFGASLSERRHHEGTDHGNVVRMSIRVAGSCVCFPKLLSELKTGPLFTAASFLTMMTSSSLGSRGKELANEATSCGRLMTCPL